MNVLMLGNGFDINYKLLTKYINFLNVVNYIYTDAMTDVKTVGDILGAEKLQNLDPDIARSYKEYEVAYDSISIREEVIERLAQLADENYLFTYLLDSFNKDVGWIDFEKEIASIIDAFSKFLESDEIWHNPKKYPLSPIQYHIIDHFSFFYHRSEEGMRTINHEYTIEYPKGTMHWITNKEKIIGILEKQMLDLADGLRVYLQYFVDNVVRELCRLKYLQPMNPLKDASHVVTFNYTNTYEWVYKNENIYHIHGNVGDRIILGVNPDESDELSSIDISFLRFKKYFQRVINHSDDTYLGWVTKTNNSASLVVMGHSLDVTDKDVIIQMFHAAKDITVLYYNENAEASLVANLIKIYGKEMFDELRIKKRLRFLPQNAPYTGFAEDRHSKEMAAISEVKSISVVI